MKARKLKNLLNDTRYIIQNNRDYISVGSPLCHDLIRVDKKTLEMKYALSRPTGELASIWETIVRLIGTGEIRDIIDGQDEIENPLPVFTVRDERLVETVTDCYGWPNTDIDGNIMYENTYFQNRKGAIEYGLREATAYKEMAFSQIEELKEQISKKQDMLNRQTEVEKHFSQLLEREKGQ